MGGRDHWKPCPNMPTTSILTSQWILLNSNLTNSLKDTLIDEFMCAWENLFFYSLRNIDCLEDPVLDAQNTEVSILFLPHGARFLATAGVIWISKVVDTVVMRVQRERQDLSMPTYLVCSDVSF